MHMADALISTPVAAVGGVIAVGLIIAASRKVASNRREGRVAMMGVLGAFVFAAQMINFTIPGTGSSGHIIGGVLLSALLGPWCGFLTLCSVLIVQCLVFADGGLMALGCNIVNMAAMSCLVAYPLLFRPFYNTNVSNTRIVLLSVAACVVGLELGAVAVSIETVSSGVTALPFWQFLGLMTAIHLAIGTVEGLATGAVLVFVRQNAPALLSPKIATEASSRRRHRVIWAFGVGALVLAGCFFWLASENPDGLEWSILQITGSEELAPASIPATSILPDYSSRLAGIIGASMVMALLWALTAVLTSRRLKVPVVADKNQRKS